MTYDDIVEAINRFANLREEDREFIRKNWWAFRWIYRSPDGAWCALDETENEISAHETAFEAFRAVTSYAEKLEAGNGNARRT